MLYTGDERRKKLGESLLVIALTDSVAIMCVIHITMETKLIHLPRMAAGKTSVRFKSGTGPSPRAYAASYTSSVITARIRKPPVRPSETAIFCVCDKTKVNKFN